MQRFKVEVTVGAAAFEDQLEIIMNRVFLLVANPKEVEFWDFVSM